MDTSRQELSHGTFLGIVQVTIIILSASAVMTLLSIASAGVPSTGISNQTARIARK